MITRHTIDQIKANRVSIVNNSGKAVDPALMPDLIAALKQNTSVYVLSLMGMDLNAYTTDLAEIIRTHPKLTGVCINGKLTPTHSAELIGAIETNHNIEEADLDDNTLGDKGANALAKAIANNPYFHSLRLIGSEISDAGLDKVTRTIEAKDDFRGFLFGVDTLNAPKAQSLAHLIEHSPQRLRQLQIASAHCAPAEQQVILDAFKKNCTLTVAGFGSDDFQPADYEKLTEAFVESRSPNLLACSGIQTMPLGELLTDNQISASHYVFLLLYQGLTAMPPHALRDFQKRVPAIIQMGRNSAEVGQETMESHIDAVLKHLDKIPLIDANDPTLTPGMLTDKNAEGYCPLDHPDTWEAFPEIAAALEAKGTPITPELLKTTSNFNMDYFEIGVLCEQFPTILHAINAGGDFIRTDDLLEEDGTANGFLKNLISSNQVRHLFTLENWEDAKPTEARSMFKALPEKAQAQVDNFYRLMSELGRQNRASGYAR